LPTQFVSGSERPCGLIDPAGISSLHPSMHQALVAAPDRPAAPANLRAFMRIAGDVEAGEALLRGPCGNIEVTRGE